MTAWSALRRVTGDITPGVSGADDQHPPALQFVRAAIADRVPDLDPNSTRSVSPYASASDRRYARISVCGG